MNNFCITNAPSQVKSKCTYKKYLKHGVWLYYDSGVKVIDLHQHVIVFYGILWQGKITDFLKNVKQNGIFYAVVLNKTSGKVQVINDFMDSFYLNYYTRANQFVVTNDIRVYGPSFKINQSWVNWSNQGVDLLQAPPTAPMHAKKQDQPSPQLKENITPLVGVKYLGAGDVLALQTQNNVDCQPVITNWFAYHRDIGPLFNAKPKHDYKSASAIAKQIVSENCQRIKEKYGKQLVHFCSTGVDSLAIKSHLGDDVPMYGFISTGFNKYNESEDLLKQLYNDHGGTLHYFDTEALEDAFNSQFPKLQKTMDYKPAHLVLMCMRDIYKLNDRVIVVGNFGDHIFWKGRAIVARHAVHRWGMKDAEKIWDRCISHYGFGGPPGPTGTYSKQSRIADINKYLSDPYPDFPTAIMALRYFKRLATFSVQQQHLVVDPYADLRLYSLLPSCDIPAQEASILNAQMQKDMISDKFLPYLSPHKAGGNRFYDSDLNNKHFRKKMINSFLKNLHD